jgi:hypothetical protein
MVDCAENFEFDNHKGLNASYTYIMEFFSKENIILNLSYTAFVHYMYKSYMKIR